MKKMTRFNTRVIAEEMQYDGVTVLSYRIEYPEFESDNYKKAIKSINQFYQGRAVALQNEFRTKLYQMAVDQYLFDIENGFPVRAFEALQTFNVTYNRACVISLYFDNYQFTGGAHGSTVRTSQTWNLRTGQMIRLRQLYGCRNDYQSYIKNKIIEQTEGVVVYFQQYDIAPYSSGIREFLLPYNRCIIDPARKCT